MNEQNVQSMTFVLFGATGDLAQRKLFPALYNLYLEGKLPSPISIIGLGRSPFSDLNFQSIVERSLREYSRRTVQTSILGEFLSKFRYCAFDARNQNSYQLLHDIIIQREKQLGLSGNRLFYLSVSPNLVDVITSNLSACGISQTNGWKRLIVEKPFGSDLKSAQQLNGKLREVFTEDEIYRIDHYLGKPIVQNLESLKLANPILDSLLNQKQIANVQITASETVGVEKRADYYDQAGAIRDMFQNHLLQLVRMTALQLPPKETNKKIGKKQGDIIESLRPIKQQDISKNVVRGQYESGEVHGKSVAGYQEEPGVVAYSKNDTFFAARLYIDNPSWSKIPFYIRTGKRLDQKSTRIVIEFRNKSINLGGFQDSEIPSNLLIIEISPHERVSLWNYIDNFPMDQLDLTCNNLSTNSEEQPESYEILLFDAINGNKTFFVHWKEVESSWKWTQPLLEAFQDDTLPLYPYPAGSSGPHAADLLLQENGFSWR